MAKISGLVCDICGKMIHKRDGDVFYRLKKPLFSYRYYNLKHNYDFCEDCGTAIILDVTRKVKQEAKTDGDRTTD